MSLNYNTATDVGMVGKMYACAMSLVLYFVCQNSIPTLISLNSLLILKSWDSSIGISSPIVLYRLEENDANQFSVLPGFL